MNELIYVTGHRHPDSDSICAAITYADLLKRCGQEAVACRQGPLNEETKFILKRFHQENPLLLTDARTMISDIDIDPPMKIRRDETVHHAWHEMLRTQNRSLFVVDENDRLVGICTTSNLSYVRLQPDGDLDSLIATAKLEDMAHTINGEVRYEPENFHSNGHINIITVEQLQDDRYPLRNGIVMMTTGEQKQKDAIDQGAACLIITCGEHLSDTMLEYARAHRCAVIESKIDTMHAARIISESYTVEHIMTKEPMFFRETDYVTDVAARMQKNRVRSYPVLNDKDEIVGAISRYHTLNHNRRKFVLVDHSAVNQTISHVEEAEIIAIIDHHHIGGIQTDRPIMYRNVKCGCTCTIISNLYQENGLLPDADMSGLLLSAILSDTLNFKSLTTTESDRIAAAWLAQRAGIADIDDYAREMLGASVSLRDSSMHDILNRDLKSYEVGSYKFAIGQTNYSRMEEVQKILPEFKETMKAEQEKLKLDLLVMLFTDVMGDGSLFVFYGPLSSVIHDMIETTFDDHSGFDTKIISRKQQMMPKLSALIKNI